MNVIEEHTEGPLSGRASVATDRSAVEPSEPDVQILLVEFRNGEAVERHPAVDGWIEKGWEVRSAVPRVVEQGKTKLLVVLENQSRKLPASLSSLRPDSRA